MSWLVVFGLCLPMKNGELIKSRMRGVELMLTGFFFSFFRFALSSPVYGSGTGFRYGLGKKPVLCNRRSSIPRDMLPPPWSTAVVGGVGFPVTGRVSAPRGRSTALAVAALAAVGPSGPWAQAGNYSNLSTTDTHAYHTKLPLHRPRLSKPFAPHILPPPPSATQHSYSRLAILILWSWARSPTRITRP